MKKNYELVLFLCFFLLIALFTKWEVTSGNSASRVAAVQSYVEHGTWAIDNSSFNVTDHEKFNDKIYYQGNFYSSKPPMLAFISVPIYWLIYYFGLHIQPMYVFSPAYYLLTLFTIGIFYSLLMLFFYKFLVRIKSKYSLLLTAGLGVGTLALTYGVVFNNHIPSMSLLFIAFYLLYFLDKSKYKQRDMLLSGLLVGFGISIDPPSMLVASFLLLIPEKQNKNTKLIALFMTFIWLFYSIFDLTLISGLLFIALFSYYYKYVLNYLKKYYLILFALLIPLFIYAYLNYQIIESPLPQHIHPNNRDFYTYDGAPWPNGDPTGLIPDFEFFVHSTIGYRGLFSYSPILVFGILGLIYLFKDKKRTNFDHFLVSGMVLSLFAYYVFSNANYGGDSYGIRRLIVLTPFILLYAKDWLSKVSKKGLFIFKCVLVLSVIFALIGVYQPWADIWKYEIFFYQPIPLLNNLKNIVQGYLL